MQRLRELDGLRAIAALSVLVAHFNVDPFKGTGVEAFVHWMHKYSVANMAVSFFYVLSAFLLTSLAVRELRETGGFNRTAFMLRRVARIWPLYWLMVGVGIFITLRESGHFGVNPENWPWLRDHLWIYGLFLGNWSLAFTIPGFHGDRSPPNIGVLWSIAVEEQFYVVYALLAGLVLVSARRLLLTCIVAAALAITYRWWHLTYIQPQQILSGVYYATPTYLEMFAYGSAAAWLLAVGGRTERWTRRVLRFPLTAIPVFWFLYMMGIRWTGAWTLPNANLFHYSLTAPAMALLVAWSVANRDRLLVRFTIGSPPLYVLGVLSFGIYVWHPVSQGVTRWLMPTWDATTSFAAYMGMSVLFACITYVVIERPAVQLMRRWRASRAAQMPPVTALQPSASTLAARVS